MALRHDLQIGIRTWARTPALASVAILTLAIGIGATATAFSLAYSVLVRPFPFPDADRLVWITSYNARTSDGRELVDNSNRMSQFLDWQEHAKSFAQLAAWSGTASPDIYTVTGAGSPERVNGLRVTQQLMPLLGAAPALGRLFVPGDDDVDAARTVILSYGYWQQRFGGRPDVIGQSINVENLAHSIAGVVSSEFPLIGSLFAGKPIDIYLPLERDPAADEIGAFMTVLGRLRPGVTIDQARADLATRRAALATGPRAWMATIVQQVTPLPLLVTRNARTPLLLVLGGIACVLILACANVANLLLVRASGRRREMHVRAALGATRRQVLRQTLTESAVLAAIAGVAGLALTAALMRLLRGATWLQLPRLMEVEIGWAGLAFTLAVCTLTTLVFGSVPLLHLRRDGMDALRPNAGVTGDRRTAHAQRLSLAAQVASALLLTVTGGLLLRSFAALVRVDPGFEPDRVIAMRIDPAGRLERDALVPFFDRVLDSVAATPGVASAALAIGLPMDRNFTFDVSLPGQRFRPDEGGAFVRMVSPAYFKTAGIRIVSGRDFQPADRPNTQLVVAINETLARRVGAYGRRPLGARLAVSGRVREVVAIVGDVKSQSLARASEAEVYVPYTQQPGWQAYDIVVRAAGDPAAVVSSIRNAVWRVDRDQAIGTPVALQALIDRTLISHRLLSSLIGAFAVSALLLSALGIYGVVGYRVAQRTKEIAICIALGAPRWRVTSRVLRDVMGAVAIGVAAGLPLALGAGVITRSYLFDIEPRDGATLMTACAVVLVAALVAAYMPARRAPRIDPITALRAE